MPRRRARPLIEWVGGRLSPPFFIEQGDEPYRAGLALWLELPSGLVVGQKVFAPKDGSRTPTAIPSFSPRITSRSRPRRRHYADWLDHPLPALAGKTPREAARTAQGRSAVDVLLKDMENHEQRSTRDAAFDFSTQRRELGLDDGGGS
jgi:hypothetical protein